MNPEIINTEKPGALAPILTPHGHLLLAAERDAPILAEAQHASLVNAFTRGTGHGLLHLGAAEVGSALPPIFAWWRDFSARYITALCATTQAATTQAAESDCVIAAPASQELDELVANAPPMTGAEYLTADVLIALWGELDTAFHVELIESKKSLQDFLKALHPAWNLVGRVHFNLAENRKDAEAPFAFIATYTTRLSAHGKAQHQPLSQALNEYSDGKSQARRRP